MADSFIYPTWNAPVQIKAFTTTRTGGSSLAPFEQLNLGAHVGDDKQAVSANRDYLQQFLPAKPVWLNQTHSDQFVDIDAKPITDQPCDASYSQKTNRVCVVMTADCLPILLTDTQGQFVSAIHAGWKGLVNNIIAKSIQQLSLTTGIDPSQFIAWLGPAIGAQHFEVGVEVKQAILANPLLLTFKHQQNNWFRPNLAAPTGQKWFCDIYAIATAQLQQLGVNQISGGDHCTYSDSQQFFSYRRDGQCGRMASCIWIS